MLLNFKIKAKWSFAYTLFVFGGLWMLLEETGGHLHRQLVIIHPRRMLWLHTHTSFSGCPVISGTALPGFYHCRSPSDCDCHLSQWNLKVLDIYFFTSSKPVTIANATIPSFGINYVFKAWNRPHIAEFVSSTCKTNLCHDSTMNSESLFYVKVFPEVFQGSVFVGIHTLDSKLHGQIIGHKQCNTRLFQISLVIGNVLECCHHITTLSGCPGTLLILCKVFFAKFCLAIFSFAMHIH